MALINILTNQKEILARVESLKILSDDEFKKLSKDYAILEKLFENFQTAQVRRDAEIEEATLEYTAQISDFGSDIEEVKSDIKSMKKIYWDVKNLLNRIMWTVGGIIAFLTIVQLFTGKTFTDFFK
jgi:seryl-tRNA synthetase